MTTTDNATYWPNYPHQINGDKTMTQPTPPLRCHDAEACALCQRPCPSPAACGCAPQPQALRIAALLRDRLGTNAAADLLEQQHVRIAELEREKAAQHYGAMAVEVARTLPTGMEPEAWRTRYRSEPGMIGHYPWTHTGRQPRQMVPPAYDIEPLYTAAQVQAMQSELEQIGAVAACFGADWPDVPGEPEILRRVKWTARQLKTAQERKPLTDERIREIDDETHFHEAPDWPVRFCRAIEAELRKKATP